MALRKKIVIGLSAALTAVLVLSVYLMVSGAGGIRQQSKKARTIVQLDALKEATTAYFGVYGQWPGTMKDLSFNRSNVVFVSPAAPWNDGWGRPFNYGFPSNGTGAIVSLGRDGRPGGSEFDADLKVSFP
jgi:type II secretory pathway pseudopilin PulG